MEFFGFSAISIILAVGFGILTYKQDKLHDLMNSRLSELLKITASSSHQAGMEQERKEEAARQLL